MLFNQTLFHLLYIEKSFFLQIKLFIDAWLILSMERISITSFTDNISPGYKLLNEAIFPEI